MPITSGCIPTYDDVLRWQLEDEFCKVNIPIPLEDEFCNIPIPLVATPPRRSRKKIRKLFVKTMVFLLEQYLESL